MVPNRHTLYQILFLMRQFMEDLKQRYIIYCLWYNSVVSFRDNLPGPDAGSVLHLVEYINTINTNIHNAYIHKYYMYIHTYTYIFIVN